MNKVTTINLNGRAYSLEERGFDALRKYLETAAAKLDGNPDKDEIMADFEQAIADKFDQRLSPAKNVISEKEAEEIIAAMGPVEGADTVGESETTDSTQAHSKTDSSTSGGDSSADSTAGAPKRLYRIPRGEWLMGVCNGLAAYFNIDVTLVRIIFILLTLFTHAFWIIAYIILAILMPPARTEEQFANAHGWTSRPPLNANDFIEQTKKRYAEWRAELEKMHDEHKAKMAAGASVAASASVTAASIKEDAHKWKHDFKKEMREKKQRMKQEWRAQQRQWHHGWQDDEYYARRYGPGYNASRAIFGFFAVIVSIVLLAFGVAWVYALYALIKYHMVYGYAIGAGHPLWVSIVFLAAAFYIIATPFRLLLQHAWGHARYQSGFTDFGRFIIFIAVCAVLIWTARELFPQANAWYETSVAWLKMRL